MSKHIELAKKLKALADRGIGGEKNNAERMLTELLEKYEISLQEIEEEKKNEYFFNIKSNDKKLWIQIVGRVNYDIDVYSFNKTKLKLYGIKGNTMITCTASEYIEIVTMWNVFSKLYKEELEIFYSAFLRANDLFANSGKESQEEMTKEEVERYWRAYKMSKNIKSQTIKKQIT